jgi:cation diffusion facilitator family transporter
MTHSLTKGLRSTLIGILTNALLAGIKGTAGVLGNSYALIADAIESTTDIASSFIVWVGLKVSGLPPDTDHPYGHGKAEPIAAAVVSMALLGAAIWIAVQSVGEILTPHTAPAPFTLLILLLVVATKETLFRFVFRVGSEISSTAVKSDAWHHRSDAITSAAAFVGISVSLIGGPGFESADDWAALFASAIIAVNAYRILRPALDEVMDAAPSTAIVDAIRKVAPQVNGVEAVEKCRVRKMGFSHYVDLHIEVRSDLTVQQGHAIAHAVRAAVRAGIPQVSDVLVHVEPAGAGKSALADLAGTMPRRDHEPPQAIQAWGWRYHHLGIPTDSPVPGEEHLPHLKIHVSGFSTSPFGVEWMRFDDDCQIHEIIKCVPHIAFEVPDLDRAMEEHPFELLSPPSVPSSGVRAAMILHNGAPVELIEFRPPASVSQ